MCALAENASLPPICQLAHHVAQRCAKVVGGGPCQTEKIYPEWKKEMLSMPELGAGKMTAEEILSRLDTACRYGCVARAHNQPIVNPGHVCVEAGFMKRPDSWNPPELRH